MVGLELSGGGPRVGGGSSMDLRAGIECDSSVGVGVLLEMGS